MKTADLCDHYKGALQVCAPMFRSFGGKRRFAGPITTVKVWEDNVLVRQAIETAPEGSIIIVDGGGSKRCALLGDRLAAIAVSRGIAGMIIHGCVRDTADLAQLDLGVLALDSMPLKSKKEGKGERDLSVRFGGVIWEPGHWAAVDEDGIVLAPHPMEL
ncbi:4-hydroxy-4-methyl-2-oxoglutarate aldolase [Marinithermofilum abyssi]|uniref:4-hydroxy-4-methyl-2-oxoglutarate aldolase n=1 Tax=Marinithermofilum abyssi TaxID=1571185 RepID=A0A8J2YA93_9BACL|nr:ribonuclease E activity regulator RraA [Marinithermofilum abyssi]GGE09009.1 4-hydroxy-4-methyl-2-oxoglutarate aldolase [Marinithermofilum abyssi]